MQTTFKGVTIVITPSKGKFKWKATDNSFENAKVGEGEAKTEDDALKAAKRAASRYADG